MSDFVFIGYLIQEPFWKEWPFREHYLVASIEREYHPKFNQHQWNDVEGTINPTRFLTTYPQLQELVLEPHRCRSTFHKQNPGWVVSGYGLPREVTTKRTITSVDKSETIVEFAYSAHIHRRDDLQLLGYEVVDTDDIFSSILNNCGYSAAQVREMAGELNRYSLLSSVEDAQRFNDAIQADFEDQHIEPDHNAGIILQVWGKEN